MPSEPKRKLAAIMFTDMVGYTALMQDKEAKARELIQRHRELMKPLVEKHSGKILQYVGDGTFITFDSAIEAVNSAIEIQKELKADPDVNLRIGIHVGDVVIDGEEVYGDGVNVASRLEPLAEPGGVCISGRVYDDIRNQEDIETEYLGKKELKNVNQPTKIYCLIGEGLAPSKPFEEEHKADAVSKRMVTEEEITKPATKQLLSWAIGAAVLLALFFGRGWFAGESSITEVTADENSLAVLFIENTTDPDDVDKSAEMIRMLLSTDLSQAQSLRVISTQRLFDIAKQERGKNDILIDRFNATSVAKQARARWMLTGTFSKVGSRMVLITELEDVWEGKIIHSQRADGGDIFSLVDALSIEIRSDMGVIASAGEIDAPVKEITTSSSIAYQQYLEGLEFLNDSKFEKAIERLQSAVEIDPNFLKALYKLARAYLWNDGRLAAREVVDKILLNKEGLDEEELLLVEALDAKIKNEYTITRDNYQKLLKMYPDEKEYHYALGDAYFHLGQEENLKALDAFEEALNLDPEFRLAYVHMFDIYQIERMDDKAIRVANRLIKSNPDKATGYRYLANIYGLKGELEKSIKNYEKAAQLNKGNYESVRLQAWAYRIGGDYEAALNKYAELFEPNVPAIWQYRGKLISSYVYVEQGQYKKAIQLTREAIRIARPIDQKRVISSMRRLAVYYSSIGDTIRAFSLLDSALAMNPGIVQERQIFVIKGNLYAGSGNQDELMKLIDILNMPTKQIGVTSSWDGPNILKMNLFRLQGNLENARLEYDKLSPLSRVSNLKIMAALYDDARDWENVIMIANEMKTSFLFGNILFEFRRYNYPRSFYIRGIAYEEMGKPELAIENYEALLELWKDADEEIPERRDTIKRLAALKRDS